MRKSVVLAAISALSFVGVANAADMPVKARPPAPAPAFYNWSGFYIGGNIGGAWSKADDFVTANTPGTPGVFGVASNIALVDALGTGSGDRDSSFTGGIQIGYNWQVSPQWLLGLETDINALHSTSTLTGNGISTIGPITVTNSVDTRWLATFRGRVGLTFDRSLIYVTGGGAVTDLKYTQTMSGTLAGAIGGTAFGSSETSNTKFGWTVGAGWEQALWDRWSAKVEYLFARFNGLDTNTTVTTNPVGFTQNLSGSFNHLDMQILRVGLNYRF
jgi:outer membrane immunogenic protein